MAIVPHELAERRHWLSQEEFVEERAVAQIMLGPNVVPVSDDWGSVFWRQMGIGGCSRLMAYLFVLSGVFPSLYSIVAMPNEKPDGRCTSIRSGDDSAS